MHFCSECHNMYYLKLSVGDLNEDGSGGSNSTEASEDVSNKLIYYCRNLSILFLLSQQLLHNAWELAKLLFPPRLKGTIKTTSNSDITPILLPQKLHRLFCLSETFSLNLSYNSFCFTFPVLLFSVLLFFSYFYRDFD